MIGNLVWVERDWPVIRKGPALGDIETIDQVIDRQSFPGRA